MNEKPEKLNTPIDEGDEEAAKLLRFWNRRKGQIGLGLLGGYLALLALGTLGEVFEIEWILNLPMFRPPGKF